MSDLTWKEISPGVHLLHCEVVAVTARARADGKFSVESSHGVPEGIYDDLTSAKKYLGQFITGMAEHALGQITMLETGKFVKADGVVPPVWHGHGAGVAAHCGFVHLRAGEDDTWYDTVNVPCSPEDAAEIAQHTGMPVASLIGMPRAVKQLKPFALDNAKSKAIADMRKHLRGVVAWLEG